MLPVRSACLAPLHGPPVHIRGDPRGSELPSPTSPAYSPAGASPFQLANQVPRLSTGEIQQIA